MSKEVKTRKEMEEEIKNMTKEEKKSSLEAPFWNTKTSYNKDSKFHKKIQEICKNINFEK